jgi:hypothetical protein
MSPEASGGATHPRVRDERPETIVERDEVAVIFKRVADDQTAIDRGWVELEEAVGSLRGRKFYGAFDDTSREYRVCVQLGESETPSTPSRGARATGLLGRSRRPGSHSGAAA